MNLSTKVTSSGSNSKSFKWNVKNDASFATGQGGQATQGHVDKSRWTKYATTRRLHCSRTARPANILKAAK